MSSCWISRISKRLVVGAALSVLFTTAGLCQTTPSDKGDEAVDEPIDEVIVQGRKSSLILRHEMYRSENKVVDMFNALNDDDQYDITCRYESPTGSNIERRVCKAHYLSELNAEARALLPSPTWRVRISPARVEEKRKILEQKMMEFLSSNPEFRELSAAYAEAQQAYKEAAE